MRNIQVYLRGQGIHTQVAPYSAAAQLVNMERENALHATSGSASCLLFGADKVIIHFDWEAKTFNWVSVEKCLKKLSVPRDQFVNICLLSGSSILPVFPDVDADAGGSRIQATRSLLGRNTFDVLSLLHDHEGYRDLYEKARFILKHPVVVTHDGKIEPLNWESGPGESNIYHACS